jgi:hypothetical protein
MIRCSSIRWVLVSLARADLQVLYATITRPRLQQLLHAHIFKNIVRLKFACR